MLKKMVIPGERIAEEESEDTDDTDSLESYPDIAPIGDIDRIAPGMLTSDSDISSPGTPGMLPSPARTRIHGKAKITKERVPFYKGYGVVYLPGDKNGLRKKLHLLATEFFADSCIGRVA